MNKKIRVLCGKEFIVQDAESEELKLFEIKGFLKQKNQ